MCASSWKSNQGYTMMHGQPIIKMSEEVYFILFEDAVLTAGGE